MKNEDEHEDEKKKEDVDPHPEMEGYNPMTKQWKTEKENDNKRKSNLYEYRQHLIDQKLSKMPKFQQGQLNSVQILKLRKQAENIVNAEEKKMKSVTREERLKLFSHNQNSNNSKAQVWTGPNRQTRVKNAVREAYNIGREAYTRGVNGLRGIFKSKTGTKGGRTRRRKRRRKTKRR